MDIKYQILEYHSLKTGIDMKSTQKAFQDLCKFLKRASSSKSAIKVPNKEVDLAWHSFILHTKEYFDFCNLNFGAIIHHYPSISENNIAECNGGAGGGNKKNMKSESCNGGGGH